MYKKIIYILYENFDKLHRNLTLYNNPICYRNLIKAIIEIILIVINGFLSIKNRPPYGRRVAFGILLHQTIINLRHIP